MKQFCVLPVLRKCLLSALLLFSCQVQAESLLVGGTGSAEPILNLLFAEFAKQEPTIQTRVIHPALGSGGGVNAVMANKIDLAVVSREAKPEEKAKIGRQFVWCKTPFVMVSNGGQRPNGYTADELAKVYQGSLSTWDDGKPIRLILRDINDSDSAVLKKMSPAMEAAVKAANQRPGMVFGSDDLETLDIETRTFGSLGPSNLGVLHNTGSRLQVLSLNGVTPSLANLQNGTYPWHKILVVMLPLKASPAAEKFARFLQSEKVAAILSSRQYLPIK